MMAAMPVFALADSDATDAAEAATAETAAAETAATETAGSGEAELAPVGVTEGGNSIYDLTVPADDTATGEEPTAIAFADDNFQISVPSGWAEQEPTEEQTVAGVIKLAADPENTLTVTRVAGEATTVDALIAELSADEALADVRVALINNVLFASYADSANSAWHYLMPDAVNGGYIDFAFTGGETASDSALKIMSTIAITDEAAASAVTPYAQTTDDTAADDAATDDTAADDATADDTTTDDTAADAE